MTLGNFIFVCNENDYEIDMYTDYTDDLAICYVGDENFKLTEEGRKEFGEILDLEVSWENGRDTATVLINHLDDETAEKMNDKLVRFFNVCAGNVSNGDYKKWFDIGVNW